MRLLLRTIIGSVTPKENEINNLSCSFKYFYEPVNSLGSLICSKPLASICLSL